MKKTHQYNHWIYIGGFLDKNGMGFGASSIQFGKYIFEKFYTSEYVSLKKLNEEISFFITYKCVELNDLYKNLTNFTMLEKQNNKEVTSTFPINNVQFGLHIVFVGNEFLLRQIKSNFNSELFFNKYTEDIYVSYDFKEEYGNLNDNLICFSSAVNEKLVAFDKNINLEQIITEIDNCVIDEISRKSIITETISVSLGGIIYQNMFAEYSYQKPIPCFVVPLNQNKLIPVYTERV